MWYNIPQITIYTKEMIHIAKGKFSQPRGNYQPQEPRSNTTGEQRGNLRSESTAVKKSVRKTSSSRARTKKVLLISLCSVAVVLLIAVIICVWFFLGWPTDDGLILNNITVAGINLGGMTKEQAAEALHRATDQTYTRQDMEVELPDTILTFSAAETGAQLDVDAVVDAAYDYGRKGTYEEREQAKESSLTEVHHIALLPYLTLNTDVIRSALEEYGANFNSEFTESSATLEGEAPILDSSMEGFDPEAPCQTLVLYLGTPGRKLDMDKVYNDVLDAYSFNEFQVIAQMEEAEKIPQALDLQALYDQYHSDCTDAVLDKETYEASHEVYGYTFDLENAELMMEYAKYGDTLRIDMEYILPENTHEELAGMLFRDVLGAFETEHTKDENRNTNLTLACAAINGLVLEPGETFDFNVVVGKRTAEAGYKSADAYSSGKTVKTLGGGVCQVSSTIYYCCLLADLEIVDRSPHSYVSSYMPMGTDATVSWGGPEFRFKNSTNYPIRIEAEVADGYVKVKLIGTDEKDYYIKMESEVIGMRTPTTVYEEIPVDDNPEGYKDGQVISTAYKGYTVQTYKCKYDKETDELIIREEDQLSKYKHRDKVIAKLVKTAAPTEAPKEDTSTDTSDNTSAEKPAETPAATTAPETPSADSESTAA